MTPRDEVVYLLHAAAEVEHALMVQYLYAAFSLNPGNALLSTAQQAAVEGWYEAVLQTAREEMGHLACVQNLLLLLGAPVNFEREDFPFRSELYPFPFRLEPLTLKSLAKYIAAERPAAIPDLAVAQLYSEEIEPLARDHNDGMPVNRVGAVFERLLWMFRDLPQAAGDDPPIQDEDLRLEVAPLLATETEWGYPGLILGPSPLELGTPSLARVAIRDLLERIAQQGEGYPSSSSGQSHFDRFIEIWRTYRQLFERSPANDTGPASPARPVPVDPVTTESGANTIRHPRSLGWAHLFNLRYRLLLGYLQHYFQFRALGANRTNLSMWTLEEMGRIRVIGEKLMARPQVSGKLADRAGPPFEQPYTLQLPDGERDRWRTHRDVLDASIHLSKLLVSGEPHADEDRSYLERLITADRNRRDQLSMLIGSDPLPLPPAQAPHEAMLALLRAKQPAALTRHGGIATPVGTLNALFEQERYDEIIQFLLTGSAVRPPASGKKLVVARKPEESGFFLQIRDGVMQGRFSEAEIGVVRNWIMSLESPPMPTATLSFVEHIRPLFRDRDINAMRFVFDLSKYEDVRDNAEGILVRLADGTMPCDGAWPPEQVQTFRTWIDQGKNP